MTITSGHQATTRQPRNWELENWETVSFVPTVGWINHYTADDGSRVLSPCPGVLVQELRSVTRYWEVEGINGVLDVRSLSEPVVGPCSTRAVAAELECGALIPADDVDGFRSTTTPDDDIMLANRAKDAA